MPHPSKESAFSPGELKLIGICTWCCGDLTAADETPAAALTCRYCLHTSTGRKVFFGRGSPEFRSQFPASPTAEFELCEPTSSGPFGLDISGCFALLPPPRPIAVSASKVGSDEVWRRFTLRRTGMDNWPAAGKAPSAFGRSPF
jgi:hypothetical protein